MGHWRMNETSGSIIDHSGNNNDGTVVSAVELGSLGKFGRSGYWVGTNDYITVPTDPTLEITGDMTISLWMWANNFDFFRVLVGKQELGETNSPAPFVMNTNGSGNLRFGRGNGTVSALASSDGVLPVREWVNVCVSQTGTAVRYFFNGVFDSQKVIDTTIGDDGQEVRIGISHSGGRDFGGFMDDIRIYNRGLSDAEVASLADRQGFAEGRVGQWRFDESSGSVLDTSAWGNNGVASGVLQDEIGFFQDGRSVFFDGINDNIVISHDISALAITGDMSINVRVKIDDFDSAHCILFKGPASSDVAGPYALEIDITTGKVRFYRGNGSTEASVVTTDASLTAGEWHHIVVIQNGTNVGFCIDDIEDSGNPHTLSTTTADSGGDLTLGAKNDDSVWYAGWLDQLEIYNYGFPTTRDARFLYRDADTINRYHDMELWFKMDEASGTAVEDHGPLHIHGTIDAGITVNQTGQVNGAYLFVKSSSGFFQADGSQLSTVGNGDFSIAFWFNTTTVDDDMAVIAFEDAGSNEALVFYIGLGTTMNLWDGSSHESNTSSDLDDGNWHHAAFVRNNTGTNGCEFFLDGASYGTVTLATNFAAFITNGIRVGYSGSDTEFFDGLLDDLRFYDRALSEFEIITLAAA